MISPLQSEADEFELRDGDRVVLLGSEFIEQQIKHNFLETELTLRWPDRNIQFRNLGWAGDTPTAIARGYFGGADEGFKRLLEELDRIKPTTIIVCYGANSKPESFEADFSRLFDELEKRAATLIVVSHPAAERIKNGEVDPTEANQVRDLASKTLKRFVESKNSPKVRFVGLFSQSKELLSESHANNQSLTTDTIRFNESGYRKLGRVLANSIVGSPIARNHDDRFELTRALIGEKNQLYFHRYRPQNETYLRGFRKHEQGQNAKEISEFDELIDQADMRIRASANGKPLPRAITEPAPIKLTFEAFTPEQERESFTLADGLSVELFAAEPMVANPIHMNFDSDGRLWVATSPIYPHIKPGAKPSDEIVVLEDTNGDGRADKRTVFADDLLIPTAVLPDELGGAYVANSTEVIHLSDTDGDGVADQRRVVLAGFGTEDTHHIVHTFRWGPDAAIYFNQSIYIHTHLETPHGVKRLMGSGIWRFEPLTVDASVSMRGLVNPWGHIFDDWGQSFATDGAGGNGINFAFPGSAYVTAVGFSNVLRGMNPGQPKLCGLEIISGRHFPDDWQQTLITNDFRGNRINCFKLSPQGSGYVSTQLPDLLSSSHRAFRPVDVKMAPDGSLFVADWYNPIINHGEVDFRDSRRDYKHGRIWRVNVKNRPLVQAPDLRNASMGELVEIMRQPEQWNRIKARVEIKNRIRVARQSDAGQLEQPVDALFDSPDPRDQLEALWTWEAIGQFKLEKIRQALASTDYRVRAAAVRIMANQMQTSPEIQTLVMAMAGDNHPQVRLEFVNAWRNCCPPQSVTSLLGLLDHPTDTYIDFALTNALKSTASHWIDSLATSEIAANPKKLMYVLRNVDSNQSVELLFGLLGDTSDPAQTNEVIQLIGQRGNQEQLKRLFDLAKPGDADCDSILESLIEGTKKRRMKVAVESAKLQVLFDHPQAIRLAGEWKIEPLKKNLQAIATGNEKKTIAHQLQAIRGLAAFGEIESLKSIAASTDQPIAVRSESIVSLTEMNLKVASELAADFFSTLGDDEVTLAIPVVDGFIRRRNGAQQLAGQLANKDLSQPLKTVLRKRAAAAGGAGIHLADALVDVAVSKMKTSYTDAEMEQLIQRIKSQGNPSRGESVYRRAELNCIKCHAIGGAGGVVGPDMISLGASSPVDYIIESLINPNAKIKEGYHTTTVLTIDGQQISGKLMSQADGQLTLRDADDKEHVLIEDDIEDQKISTTSLMPADSLAGMNEADFNDLVAFLSALGKEGPFKVSTQRLVRRWFTPDGKPIFTRVDGSLPLADFEGNVVSFEIEVTEPGPIAIQIENPNGLRITLNEMKDNLRAAKIVSDLPKGKHRFTFKIGNRKNRETVRAELVEIPGSNAHASICNQ